MVYAAALTDGVHDLMTKESAPSALRIRAIIAKLRAAPSLLAAARTNIKNPPQLFAQRGAAAMHGAADMLGKDLDLAFASEPDKALRDSLRRAADVAIPLINAYAAYLEKDVIPTATGDFTIGAANLARRYVAEEMIDTPLETMVAIGERELLKSQAEFRAAANKLAPGKDPQATWLAVRKNHPLAALSRQRERSSIADVVRGVARHRVGSAGRTRRRGSGLALRPRLRLDARVSAARAQAGKKRFLYNGCAGGPQSRAAGGVARAVQLCVAVEHRRARGGQTRLHSTYMRKTPGKIRRIWIGLNPFPQPSSGQDGWAHYAEQMVLDEGFGAGDPRLRLAQLSDALTRICRLLSGIKVHTKQWTLADAQRCFEKDAYVAAPAAKREAERRRTIHV
jgi:hypothetical protein